ncbi:transposable element Tcb1 transposase [Trichonephila clavipes]|nr:transposable element Tcb1 transposase [Trichonephila clavipes]
MRQTYSRSEESEKILGIIFDPNITWKNHINYLRQKGFKYLNAIKALSSPKIGTRSDHLLNIINATIRSIFDYGSQLFSFSSNSNRQKLEPIYNAALRLALGLPRNTPLDLLRAESMNGSINNRHNFLCKKFITKQIALKDWSPNARRSVMSRRKLRSDFDQVSELDRKRIVAYRDCGLSFRQIFSHVARNQTTVMRICDHWMQEDTTHRPGQRHPPQCNTSREDS